MEEMGAGDSLLHVSSEQLRLIVRTQQEISTCEFGLDQLMGVICERAQNITGGDSAVVEMTDGDWLVYRAVSGALSGKRGLRLLAGTSLSGLCIRENSPLLCVDTATDARTDQALCRKLGIGSMIVVPLVHESSVVGVLKVASSKVHAFGDEQLELLRLMADLLSASLWRSNELEARNSRISESREDFRLLTESIPQIVWQYRSDGKLAYMNSKWEEYTGVPAETASWGDVLHPDDVSASREAWERSLATGEPFEVEYRLKARSGEYRWFLARGVPKTSAGGKAVKWFGTTTDIHETKEAKLRLREAEEQRAASAIREQAALEAAKLKSEFLANMSHEIRTPINGVIGMIDLLIDTSLNAEQVDYAAAASASANSLLTVINDILDFSKLEAGKLVIDPVDFAVRPFLAEIERSFAYSARARGLAFAVELDPGMPDAVRGDPGRVRQILNNLVGNAIKFTERGKVTVRGRGLVGGPGRVRLRFEVEDSGIGISPEALGRLFEPFSQADASTSRRFGGTGLGLSICKYLVDRMGGRIGVRSEENRGSTFWFELELEAGAGRRNVSAAENRDSGTAHRLRAGARVLIAEDNATNQVIAVKLLEKLGLRAHAVGSGREALDALRAAKYDLILMDCQMPGMDGYEATREIRTGAAFASTRAIPIVAMTANALIGDREKCLAAGMDDYLSKPVRARDLARTLARFLADGQDDVAPAEAAAPSAPAPEAEAIVLEADVIDELLELGSSDSGEPTILLLIRMFLANAPAAVAGMKSAAASGNFSKVAFEAHKLTSSAAHLGAPCLTERCSGLERSPGDAHLLAEVERELARTVPALEMLAARVRRGHASGAAG